MSSSDNVRVYGLKHPAKSLASMGEHLGKSRFLVGTWSPMQDNEVHILELEDEEETGEETGRPGGRDTVRSRIFSHPPAIHRISPAPFRGDIFFTIHDQVHDGYRGVGATLWRVPKGNAEELEKVDDLAGSLMQDDPVGDLVWDPRGLEASAGFATIGGTEMRLWTLHGGVISSGEQWALPKSEEDQLIPLKAHTGAWSPHTPEISITDGGVGIYGYDPRSAGRQTYSIPDAHGSYIRSLEYNPHVPHQLASASEDRTTRIWDIRHPSSPVLELTGHTHWTCEAAYNPVHDQLMLTGGSDARVLLHSLYSVSSAAFAEDVDADEEEPREDGEVWAYDGHDDSVYGVAWSGHDPWVFASLGYGGRVIVGTVPDAEKYKVLL